MNPSILILPALLGTLAASAAHTLPADLRHDAVGKAPLTVARMAIARGAGSGCRLGCNEPNTDCEVDYYPSDPFHLGTPLRVWGQDWSPHMECGYATGSDTCFPLHDVVCNVVYDYPVTGATCQVPADKADTTTSSLCAVAVPISPETVSGAGN